MATKIAAIPSPTDKNLKEVARAVKNVLDVREGVAGDPLDSNVTFRDLVDGGVISVSLIKRGSGTPDIDVTPGGDDSYDPTTDLSIPPAPQGLIANGLFAAIAVSWSNPPQSFRNFAYAELWRSATNAVGSAVRIAATTNNAFIDYLGNNETRYYWVRFVSQANVIGPWNGTSGTSATTSQNPGVLLDSLISAITATELDQTLTNRIDLIDGPALLSGSVNERILAETNARIAALSAEATARDNADDLLQSQIDALSGGQSGDLSGLIAAINAEIANRIAGDLAEANARQLADAALQDAVNLEEEARIAADAILSAINSLLGTQVGNATSGLVSEYNARTLADAILTQVNTNISTGLGATISTLLAEQNARNVADNILAAANLNIGTRIDAAITALLAETNARSLADSIINGALSAVGAVAGQSVAAVGSEVIERLTEQEALASTTNAVVAALGGNAAALVVEREARATQDSAIATQVTSLAATVNIGDSSNSAALVIEQQARADADGALSSQTTTLSAAAGANSAALKVEQQARTDTDSSLSAQTTTLAAQTAQNTAGLLLEQQARTDSDGSVASQVLTLKSDAALTSAALKVEQSTRADADTASATQVTTLSAKVDVGDSQNSAALIVEQGSRADADSAQANQITSLASAVGGSAAALRVEQTVRSTEDQSISSQITSLSAATGGALAAIQVEQVARTDEDSALSQTSATLAAQYGSALSGIVSEATARASADTAQATVITGLQASVTIGDQTNTAAILTEQQVRASADESVASQVDSLSASFGANNAAILLEQSVRSTADEATASQVAGLAATSGANSAAIEVEELARATADGAITSRITTVSAQAGALSSALQVEQTASANANSATSQQITTIAAATAGNSAGLLQEQTARVSADASSATNLVGLAANTGSTVAALITEQQARTTADESVVGQSTTLLSVTAGNSAAIGQEIQTRTDADSAVASQVSTLTSSVGANSALIQQESQARADADDAEAAQRLILAARVTAAEGDIADNAAAIVVEQLARTTADSAISSQTTTVSSAVGANNSAIVVEQTSRSNADTATATQVATVGAATSSALSGITVEQTARAGADSATAQTLNALVATTSTTSSSIKTEQDVRADATSASAAQVSTLGAVAGQNAAAIFSEQVARADEDSALTAQSIILGASVGENRAAVAVEQLARATADSAAANQINSLTAVTAQSSSAITTEQTVRSDSNSALANQFASIVASTGSSSAALFAEEDARTTADSAQASQVSGISAATQGNSAALVSEQSARATSDSAQSSRIDATVAAFGTNSAAIFAEQTARATENEAQTRQISGMTAATGAASAAIAQEATARSTGDTSSATVLSGLTASTSQTAAGLVAEQSARATQDTANATQISQLSASVGSNSAAISTEQSVRANQTGELYAQYTVKLDTNGYVAGFGLASTVNNTGDSSSVFGIRADRFYVGSPSQTNIIPFVVQATAGTAANGTPIPAGVYMDAAYIKNATITAAKISDVDADTIKAGYLQTVDFSGSTLVGSELYIGGTVTYEYNYPGQPTRITGVASVANPNIALKSTGAEFAVNYFKLKSSASATASDVFTVVNGNVVLNADKINATTLSAITSNLGTVNAGVVQSTDGKAKFDLNNARIVFNNGTHMKVVGNGFGQNSDLLEWYGPTQSEASNFAACTTANGYSYVKATTTAGGLTTGTIAFMRALRIGDHNGNIVLDAGTGTYADAIRNSAITVTGGQLSGIGTTGVTVDLSYAPRQANLAQNSDFSASAASWALGYNTSGGVNILVERDVGGSENQPTNGHSVGIYRYGDALTGVVDAAMGASSRIPVLPNTRYEVSAYIASHRCDAYIVPAYYDSAGQYITESSVGYLYGRYPGGNNLADWARPFAFIVTPPNARTMNPILRTLGVDNGTNLNTYSSDMAKWNAVSGMVVTSNAATGPFGTPTADTVSNVVSTPSSLSLPLAYDASTTYTRSFYAKAVSGTGIIVSRAANTAGGQTNAQYNLLTGVATIVSGSPATCSMTLIADGWYRCIHTFTTAATTPTNVQLFVGITSGAAATTVAIEGVQTEQAATAGTFIFTTSSAITSATRTGYAWMTRLFVGPANTNQNTPSEWFPSSVGSIDQLGYTGALNATKNTVTRSTSDPVNAATTDGDIWIDTDASPSQLVYVRSGGAWQVSANYLTAGTELSDYNALSNANITLNSDGSLAGAGGGTAAPFEPYHAAMWDFRGTVGPWGGVNCTVSAGNDVLIQTGTATASPYVRILHGGISIPGEIFNKVRIKYRRTVGAGAWKGHVYYTTAAHTGFTATYRKIIAAPVATIVNGDWYISEWDMSTLTDGGTDWVTSTITGLRFDFTSSANETWEVDWVIVGRYGSGEWTFNTINPTNQLTSGNIGTYIQNLAVGTLQIGSGTVTVPTIAVNTSSVATNASTYVTLVTLNVTIASTGDTTTDSNIPFVLKWAFESVGQVSGPVARSVQIRRTAPSALTVYTSSTQTRDVQDFVSGVAQTTLTAGSQHTFVLEVRGGANAINRSSLWTMAARR